MTGLARLVVLGAASGLLLSCGSDDPADGGPVDVGPADVTSDAGGPANEDAGDDDPNCALGTVLLDGGCYERCGINGPLCTRDQRCVRFEGTHGCRPSCGRNGGCSGGEICYAQREDVTGDGFCAPGSCPDGSHKDPRGFCICDGAEQPPGVACEVIQCGPANPDGECIDPEQICVDGVCR